MIDVEAKNWHVVTKARNGIVSLIRNLSLAEAIAIRERLDPMYGINLPPGGSYTRMCQDSDIEMREILGPEGWSE